MGAEHRIILDTDIGSDVDDALALALILGSPEAELLGVTTVYGDTLLRARLARRLGKLAGRDVPVYCGIGTPLSGRDVWWPGHEGSLHEGLENESIQDEDAVNYLLRQVAEHPGEVDIVAIGPLTNIAAALKEDPAFERNVRHLWIMGGAFGTGEVEHNFRSDDLSASIVFKSSLNITVTGLEITRKVEMRRDQLELISAAGPLGAALDADIRQWWEFWNEEWNVPHDPITVLTLLRPGLFDLSVQGTVSIAGGGESAGLSTFMPDASGKVRRVTTIDANSVAAEISSRIVSAGSTRQLHEID
ncbi:nucleoside hydrolase [Arthrobacter sp. AZCC_0090]|uniref:nucleoside hydrolase n=1 Tax=Arthrobacter sp. AZCC_0090 TaxID=2735881 RepID=UPI0016128F6D|nr:nucleoside hydrolase [Arthrobacter sp. AZCC_0090]MBB6405575.1 purine nucleosidase [Arthrobacter sp. AZCC_0090]